MKRLNMKRKIALFTALIMVLSSLGLYNLFAWASDPDELAISTYDMQSSTTSPPGLDIAPMAGTCGFYVRLFGELDQDVVFYPGSDPAQFTGRVYHSSTIPQTLQINATFSERFDTYRTVTISAVNGFGFRATPGLGMRSISGSATFPSDWAFDAALQENPFLGIVTGFEYARNPQIRQYAGANHYWGRVNNPDGTPNNVVPAGTLMNTYNPLAGTFTFTVAPGVDMVTIPIMLVTDMAFSAQVAQNTGRVRYNPITVTVSETEDAAGLIPAGLGIRSATLAEYRTTGTVYHRYTRVPNDRLETKISGDAWTSDIRISNFTREPSHGERVFNGRQLLQEMNSVTIRVPRSVSHYDDLTFTLTGGGSNFTDQMWSYELVTTNPSFTDIIVTFRQAHVGSTALRVITIGGIIPPMAPDEVLNNVNITPIQSSENQFYALGSTTNTMNVNSLGTHRIRTPDPGDGDGVPSLRFPPVTNNHQWSGQNPADGIFMPVGAFNVENPRADTLYDQAIFIQVSPDPRIGVFAVYLPTGNDGIVDLVVTTRCGMVIEMPPLTANRPSTSNRPFATVAIDFRYYGLQPGQYIDTIFFELAGGVPPNSTFNRIHNFYAIMVEGLPISLFGELPLGSIPEDQSITPPHEAWAGVRFNDPTDTYFGYTDLRAINPDLMANRRETLVSRGYGISLISSNVSHNVGPTGNSSGGTLIAGETRTVSFSFNWDLHSGSAHPLNTYGVQGFSVFLHSPVNTLNVNMDSVRVSQGGVTWGNEASDLPLPIPVPLINPNHGNASPVMRLDFPDIMLGAFSDMRSDSDTFRRTEPMIITFDVEAPMTARTGTVFWQNILGVTALQPHIPGTRNSTRAYRFATMSSDFNFGDALRTPVGRHVATPNSADTILISPQPYMLMYTDIMQFLGGLPGPWVNYDWVTSNQVLDVNPGAGEVFYRATMVNNTGRTADDFYVMIPIPKIGEYPLSDLQDGVHDGFNWSMELSGQPILPPNYIALFSDEYADIAATSITNWVVWGDLADIGGRQNVRTVKIIATAPIPADATDFFIIPMDIGTMTEAQLAAVCGTVNAFSSILRGSTAEGTVYSVSLPVAVRIHSGMIAGTVFNDRNRDGIKNGTEPGINGVEVRLYDATGTTHLASTVTRPLYEQDAFGVYQWVHDGWFAFIPLSAGDEHVIEFVNPNASQWNFSLMNPALSQTGLVATSRAYGVLASRILPSSWHYRHVNAGLHYYFTVRYFRNDGTLAPGDLIYRWTYVQSGTTIAAANVPADPTRPGFDFVGWALSPGGPVLAGALPVGHVVIADVDFYAIWEVETPPVTTVPVTTVPVTTPSETTAPVTTVPETTVPFTTVPETTVPFTTVPETTVPFTTVPETTIPSTGTRPTTAPLTTAPVTTTPVTTAPVTTVPVTTVPVTTVPVTTALVTTAPVTTVPVTTAPITTVPVTTAPITTVPVTTAPITTVPVTTAP
ncbi:MAG: hypothetical protein FWC71_11710, partial [Defluviitaleaceae bacterium]|nr:hypothetical protein [Defluviitaleaceae bacterium]